ncbi:hypothetical protein [Candidatus Poriferisodalis sp.]
MNDATALVEQVRAGEIDAASVVDEAIARCEAGEPDDQCDRRANL